MVAESFFIQLQKEKKIKLAILPEGKPGRS